MAQLHKIMLSIALIGLLCCTAFHSVAQSCITSINYPADTIACISTKDTFVYIIKDFADYRLWQGETGNQWGNLDTLNIAGLSFTIIHTLGNDTLKIISDNSVQAQIYNFKYIDSCITPGRDTIYFTLTFKASPAASITGTTTGCGSVLLTATGGTSYSWNGGNTPNSASNSFANSGTYKVTVTNSNNCSATASKVVSIDTIPVPGITGTTIGCGSVSLIATGGASYSWSGGSTPNTALNSFVTSGTYQVTVTNGNNCSASTSQLVTVYTIPTVGITGATSGCGSVSLTAIGGTSYSWNGGSSPNSATNSFASGGTYKVTVTNGSNCSATASQAVIINTVPTPGINGTTTACGSVSLTATGGATYSWSGGSTPNTALNSFVTSGTYQVTVTNSNSCSASASQSVTVYIIPTAGITGTATGCGSVSLTATGGTSYSWNGGTSPNSATNSFASGGTYKVTVTNGSNCTATASQVVIVNTIPIPGITGTATSCDSVTLTATGGTSYRWNGGSSPNTALNSFTSGGTYQVTVTNSNNCSATASKIVTVIPIVTPLISIAGSPSGAVCFGTNVMFTATPTNGGNTPVYQWKKNGSNIGNNTNTYSNSGLHNNDTITCVITSNATCASPLTATSDTIIMSVNTLLAPAVSITQSPVGAICAQSSVTYTASPVNGGGAPHYNFRVNGISVQNGTLSTYTSDTLTNNDVLTCVITSSATCASPDTAISNSILLTVNPILNPSISISISSGNQITCKGTSVDFSATTANGGTAPNYSFLINGDTVQNGTSASYTSSTLNNNDSISCVLAGNAICASAPMVASSIIVMDIVSPPVATIAVTSDTICSGDSVTLYAGASGSSYQWQYKNNGQWANVQNGVPQYINYAGTLDSVINIATDNSIMPGSYAYHLIASVNNNICPADTSQMANVIIKGLPPTPVFVPSANIICAGANSINMSIKNDTITSSPSSYTYLWNSIPGGLPVSGIQTINPSFSFPDAGSYTIQLIITNAQNCSNQYVIPVYINGGDSTINSTGDSVVLIQDGNNQTLFINNNSYASYQWGYDSSNLQPVLITGATFQTYSYGGTLELGSRYYWVLICNSNGCCSKIYYNSPPQSITQIPVITSSTSVKLYPNPTTGMVNIETPGMAMNELNLYDLAGRKIMAKAGNQQEKIELNIGNLQSGIYVGQIVFENNVASRFRIVLEK